MKVRREREAAAGKRWTCPTCHRAVPMTYCPECGECQLRPHDLTLRGFVSQVILASTNLDAPILRSFRCLILRPGVLTLAYLRGERRAYALPLQLFLVAN